MKTFLVAPDKFKGSLSTFEVCTAIEEGLLQASAAFNVIKCPMADGGDGLADVIQYYTGAAKQYSTVQGPLGKLIQAEWLLSGDGKTAFVEMAQASGLGLLQRHEYNPLLTSTFGTGQLIKAAMQKGVEKIILGIGGSATNDGGLGMAAALGFRFLDRAGKELQPVGGNLGKVETIDVSGNTSFSDIQFQVACDVKNVLIGDYGAAHVYAKQKGADTAMIQVLEEGMVHFAAVINKYIGIDVTAIEGGGAAGGLGAGAVAFLNASLVSGINLVMAYADLETLLLKADYVITGEGKIDEQTLQGKVVQGVAAVTRKHGKKLLAFCGSQTITAAELANGGIDAVFPVIKYPMRWEDAKRQAFAFLRDTAFSVGNLVK